MTNTAQGETLDVTVCGVHRDEGSIVVFWGQTNDGLGAEVLFAVDHRCAQDLVTALDAGEFDTTVVIEPWQVVRFGR